MSGSSPLPLSRSPKATIPSEAERSLLYADMIGLAAGAAIFRTGAALEAHAKRPRNHPGK